MSSLVEVNPEGPVHENVYGPVPPDGVMFTAPLNGPTHFVLFVMVPVAEIAGGVLPTTNGMATDTQPEVVSVTITL